MAGPKPLTRDQLAKFLPDQEAIRRFEQLFQVAAVDSPDQIVILFRLAQEIAIEASTALSAANAVATALQLMIEDTDLSTVIQPVEIPDDLSPPIPQLGTLASQNSDTVSVGTLSASGAISADSLSATTTVSAVDVVASGDVGTDTVTATGNVEATSYSVNGNAGASGTGTTITAITVENGIVTAITVI